MAIAETIMAIATAMNSVLATLANLNALQAQAAQGQDVPQETIDKLNAAGQALHKQVMDALVTRETP